MSKNYGNAKGAKFGSIGRLIMVDSVIFLALGLLCSILDYFIPSLKVLFVTICAAAVLVISIILSHGISKRLKQLYTTIHELSLGHIDARSNIRTNNDTGLISKELDGFADYIGEVIDTVGKISDGNISMNVESKDSGDKIAPELKKIISCMRSLSHDTERLINSVNHGNLKERGYTNGYKGSWKYLMEAMNTLMDKIATPLDEVMEVTKCLAVNDYTREIKNQYEGSFDELCGNINAVRENLLLMQDAFVSVSKGDTDKLEQFESLGKKSENDFMTPSIIKLMQTVKDLITEVESITSESSKGNITNTRGDASKFEGGYRDIIESVNNTLDTIVKPLKEATGVLNALAVNDLTVKPDSSVMVGEFQRLGNTIEQVQSNLETVQKVAVEVSNGDISALEQLKQHGKSSENDMLTPAFIKMMESLSALIDETTALANAAIDGRLDYRSNTDNFTGEYANIMKSFNSAFHNMAKPVREISGVMEQVASGTLSVSISGEYKGAFGKLANGVNDTLNTIKTIAHKMSFVLTNIAKGNLNIEKVEEYQGDFSVISKSLNNIIDTINELMSSIRVATDQVASGAKQVSGGSQNLSQGATEQASSVEELTASISEISSQTKNNAANANEANSIAETTKKNAALGNEQMKQMLTAINDINESSSNISKIIKVIDDIAFQTNILALNAAVEAARAGQYGKGFAVVADEVRNLAAKSANAAKDTTNLIEGSLSKIETGTQIAGKTADALSSIMSNVDKVSSLVSEIATASNEQATSIAQIDKGVEVVSTVVQTNSATAEESAAASEQLSSQAEYLKEMLSKFSLREAE